MLPPVTAQGWAPTHWKSKAPSPRSIEAAQTPVSSCAQVISKLVTWIRLPGPGRDRKVYVKKASKTHPSSHGGQPSALRNVRVTVAPPGWAAAGGAPASWVSPNAAGSDTRACPSGRRGSWTSARGAACGCPQHGRPSATGAGCVAWYR